MKNLNLLSKTEMKNVMGGLLAVGEGEGEGGVGQCAATFDTSQGQGGATHFTSNTLSDFPMGQGVYVIRGISKAEALSLTSKGGHWCCTSCATASWY